MMFLRLLLAAGICTATAIAPTGTEKRDFIECVDAIGKVDLTSIPTLSPDVAKMMVDQADAITVLDPCVVPAFTGTLAPAYTSYMVAADKWQQENYEPLSSLVSACSDLPGNDNMQKLFESLPTPCPKLEFLEPAEPAKDFEDEVELRRFPFQA